MPPEPTAAPVALLVELIAATTLATPGVVRLEPTLKNALHQLSASAAQAPVVRRRLATPGATDGVTISTATGVADVTVDLVTSAAVAARVTAELVQDRITALLAEHGHRPGTVSVTVLSVERG